MPALDNRHEQHYAPMAAICGHARITRKMTVAWGQRRADSGLRGGDRMAPSSNPRVEELRRREWRSERGRRLGGAPMSGGATEWRSCCDHEWEGTMERRWLRPRVEELPATTASGDWGGATPPRCSRGRNRVWGGYVSGEVGRRVMGMGFPIFSQVMITIILMEHDTPIRLQIKRP